jgi:hypothetical protein
MYATCAALRLPATDSTDTLAVEYAIAAQPPILHFRADAGCVARLGDEQLPIGLLPEARYCSHTLHVRRNDLLLIATDGIRDAENRHGEAFGPYKAGNSFAQTSERAFGGHCGSRPHGPARFVSAVGRSEPTGNWISVSVGVPLNLPLLRPDQPQLGSQPPGCQWRSQPLRSNALPVMIGVSQAVFRLAEVGRLVASEGICHAGHSVQPSRW